MREGGGHAAASSRAEADKLEAKVDETPQPFSSGPSAKGYDCNKVGIAMADATAREQLILEMINRARMDPEGEAARYGISLNPGAYRWHDLKHTEAGAGFQSAAERCG